MAINKNKIIQVVTNILFKKRLSAIKIIPVITILDANKAKNYSFVNR